MNRTEKQQLIDDLHADFTKSPHAIVVDFRGLTVPAVTEFRRKVRASNSRYRVVKNSLALRAVKGTPLETLHGHFQDTTGVAYTADDPVALAKVLVDFAKEFPALKVKAGVVSGSQVLDPAGVKALSTMPGLPELRAKLLGLLQTPATQIVRLLGTTATQLAQVLKAHEDKQGAAQA
jgi:large subunit ribosomal protein L10